MKLKALNKRSLGALMTTVIFAVTLGLANATPITPGQTSVAVSVAPTNPLTTGTIVANTGVQNFNMTMGTDSLIGTGQEWVVKNYAGNPFGATGTTFVLQVSLSGAPPNVMAAVIERVTNAVFTGFLTVVMSFVSAAGQVVPTNADRSANGAVVAFNFNIPNILPGQTSALLIINTNAPSFTSGTMTVQDGFATTLNGFAPSVPDGGNAVALLGIALVGVEFLRRKLAAA